MDDEKNFMVDCPRPIVKFRKEARMIAEQIFEIRTVSCLLAWSVNAVRLLTLKVKN
ncbi:MAG: hypothetical protein IPP66_10865 [Anaerolineales bacterium]|nr:hypothetical protein [Anaerolineales bacterium]